jgi:hypothetical protein
MGAGSTATGHGRPAWLAPDKVRSVLSAAINKESNESKREAKVVVSQEYRSTSRAPMASG